MIRARLHVSGDLFQSVPFTGRARTASTPTFPGSSHLTTDDADLDTDTRGGALLRLVTLVIGGMEFIFFLLFAHLLLHASDPLGAQIGLGMTLLMTLPLVALTLPGIALAWLGRAPRTSLALVLLALPAAVLLWSGA